MRRLTLFELRWPRLVVAVACVAAPPLGLLYGVKFLSHLQLNIEPPASSAAYRAMQSFKAAFPLQAANTEDSFILLLSRGGRPVVNSSAPACRAHPKWLATRCPLAEPLDRFSARLEAWLTATLPSGAVNDSTLSSYHRYHRNNFTLLQTALLSSPAQPLGSNTTLMRLQVPPDRANADFTKLLLDEVNRLVSDEGGADEVDARVTGMPAFIMAAQDGVKKDIEEMDTISFPLALLIFIIMLRSIRLLILPILNIGVVVSGAFALMYPIALHIDVGSTVPTLMLSVSIAMSIDYSLFLLSRFREEIESGRAVPKAVERMMGAAGHTVLISGTTLALCFGGITFLPLQMLRTMGIGAGATAALSVIVNLTLTPTLLLTFPNFFSDLEYNGFGCIARLLLPTNPSSTIDIGAASNISTAPLVVNYGSTDSLPQRDAPLPPPDTLAAHHAAAASSTTTAATAHMNGDSTAASSTPIPKALRHPHHGRIKRATQQCWGRVAGCTQRFAILTIVIIFLTALPFLLKLPKLTQTADFSLVTPRGAACSLAYNQVIQTFGSGADAPYQLLLTPRATTSHMAAAAESANAYARADAGAAATSTVASSTVASHAAADAVASTVASQPFFDDTNALIRYLASRNASSTHGPLIELSWLMSVTGLHLPKWLTGGDKEVWLPISYNNYTHLEGVTHIAGRPTQLGPELRMLWDQQVSKADGNRTMLLGVRLPFDPFGDQGKAWLQDMRNAMSDAATDPECECTTALDVEAMQLAGGGSGILDAIATVYEALPLMIGMIFSTAFAIILFAFRSLAVPLRAVVSIALTVGWVYGFLIWVYQEGGLAWTGIASLQPTPSGICWLVPVITFPVLVGLGLDYDVFLLTRVYELRLSGATTTKAITRGLVRSGNVITAAGLIMAIAFWGLLLTSTPTMNQTAVTLVTSVLLDTFVVRTLLLPAIMTLLGRYNWWPRRMPEPNEEEEKPPLGCALSCTEIDVDE